MTDIDRLRVGQHAGRQAAALRRYVADDVYPYSRLLRPRLDRCGLGARGVRSLDDLRRLPPLTLEEVGDGQTAVLAASGDLIKSHGPLGDKARLQVADLTRTRESFARDRLEPRFKPIHWCEPGALPIAMTATDLDDLGDLGRRALEMAGVRSGDRVVTVEPPSSLAFWQLTLGCRAGGVMAMHLGPTATVDEVAAARPTVLAGSPPDLLAALAGGRVTPRLVIAVLHPAEERARAEIAAAAPGAEVRCTWAPAGARALWAECPRGHLHTWPDAEVIEIIDPLDEGSAPAGDGEIVWSALGWRGTVVLRLRTGAFGRLDHAACPCGRTTPRLSLVAVDPPFAVVLDADPRVQRWYAELDGATRPTRLYVQPAGRATTSLRRDLAEALTAEVRLVRSDRIDALVAGNGGARVARTQQ